MLIYVVLYIFLLGKKPKKFVGYFPSNNTPVLRGSTKGKQDTHMKNRIELEYCKDEGCRGHKGPNGVHAHVKLFREGVEKPTKGPAFGSRKAGAVMALVMDEATASDEEKRVSALISSAVAAADLPETFGDDDLFVESFKSIPQMMPIVDVILIFGGAGHEQITRMISHNEHIIVLVGCRGCGATMGFYKNDRLLGSANGVRNVDEAKQVLSQATEKFRISVDDTTALREHLPKLFTA